MYATHGLHGTRRHVGCVQIAASLQSVHHFYSIGPNNPDTLETNYIETALVKLSSLLQVMRDRVMQCDGTN